MQSWHGADPFSSSIRPVLIGSEGAVSAAHPLAVAAGQTMLGSGGSAVDAAIAAQAVLCVLAPDACGLGGDMFAIVSEADRDWAINGAGAAPRQATTFSQDGANSITVPGIAGGWAGMHRRWGRLAPKTVLAPAIRLSTYGHPVSPSLARSVAAQRERLLRGGAANWPLVALKAGDAHVQPRLAAVLSDLAHDGFEAFYTGASSLAVEAAVARHGGALDRADLATHTTEIIPPLTVSYAGCEVAVQPPPTQGVLLAMALNGMHAWAHQAPTLSDHLAIELTEAAFAYRDDAALGIALLDHQLHIDPDRASMRGGPRAYLHTAGVAAADAQGLVVSSLVSVFDDFGSCVFVPELGITLNNRAGGFTSGANVAAPGKRPIHTLSPALLRGPQGRLALATPGADGQVQTLLQVIDRLTRRGESLAAAIAAPRWRSESGTMLIERGHPATKHLAARGHRIASLDPGDMRFGAIACAGISDGLPLAIADWRRENWAGVI